MDWKNIGKQLAGSVPIVILFIFAFQLGQYNVHLGEQMVRDYCSEKENVNFSVGWTGEIGIWTEENKLNTSVFNSTEGIPNGK
jgi:hypothetical protein